MPSIPTFAELGYPGTSMNQVAQACGLSKPALYHYFRDKYDLLVQIADFDRYVPADSVAKTAVHGRGEVHHYPCDHFDVWPGHAWHDKVVTDQIAFLTRALATASPDMARQSRRA